MISSTGIGSGLDVAGIVSSLMQVEKQKLINLQADQATIEADISFFGQLKSALSSLQSTVQALKSSSGFESFSATSSDTDILTATADGSAQVTSHTINVADPTKLAQAHRLTSKLFSDGNTAIGTGNITISNGEESFVVSIDDDNNTLLDIKDAINNAANNIGVTASVVNIDGGSKLYLTANQTGLDNAIEVTVSNDGDGNDTDNTTGLSQLVYEASGTQNMTELDAARDAQFTVDGFSVSSSSNTVTDVIEGVSFTLLADGEATISVSQNTSVASNSLQTFVKAYNDVVSTVRSLGGAGLRGEASLLSIETGLRNVIGSHLTGLAGSISSVFDVGLTFDKEGVLSLDSAKLSNSLASDFEGVVELFSDQAQGLAQRFDSLIEGYTGIGGIIASRIDGLSGRSNAIDDDIISEQSRLSGIESDLIARYSALDSLMVELQATSNFLTSQLSILPSLQINRDN